MVDRNRGKHRNKLIELLPTNCCLVTVIHCCVERIYKVWFVFAFGANITNKNIETSQFYHHYCIVKNIHYCYGNTRTLANTVGDRDYGIRDREHRGDYGNRANKLLIINIWLESE